MEWGFGWRMRTVLVGLELAKGVSSVESVWDYMYVWRLDEKRV
jgi:hypothetical protein